MCHTARSSYDVFLHPYDKLCDVIVNTNSLLSCFVSCKIIKIDDQEELMAKDETKDRIIKLLSFIEGLLRAGNVDCFYTLLVQL